MKNLSVLVVPEVEDFKMDVSHGSVVWINKKLGKPDLKGRNAKYLLPYWIGKNEGGNRIFHIEEMTEDECYSIRLGNSFVLPEVWKGIGQKRRYEYCDLKNFNFTEICPGLLTKII